MQGEQLMQIFDNNTFEMVWVFYSGITGFKSIEIKNILSDATPAEKAREAMIKISVLTSVVKFQLKTVMLSALY